MLKLTLVAEGAPVQIQVLQRGDLGQSAHSAIPHPAASGQRQPLQSREGLQRKHPCVADLHEKHSSHQCTWLLQAASPAAGLGDWNKRSEVMILQLFMRPALCGAICIPFSWPGGMVVVHGCCFVFGARR